jgi:protocatechuate 3,4-dioxygenase beta subunit
MKPLLTLMILTLAFTACAQKNQPGKNDISVGGPCEGCEAIYESPIPFARLSWIDTLPDFNDPGPKMEVTGIIYQLNGQPAS